MAPGPVGSPPHRGRSCTCRRRCCAASSARWADLAATAEPVRAAGGVLWRPSDFGPQYAVVHRPRYDDWSLPKGKLDKGEHPLAAAVREIREETGVRAHPQLRLPLVSYELPGAVPKTVDFWLMRADSGPVAPLDAYDDE